MKWLTILYLCLTAFGTAKTSEHFHICSWKPTDENKQINSFSTPLHRDLVAPGRTEVGQLSYTHNWQAWDENKVYCLTWQNGTWCVPIGWFNEAGLHEWMPFVIFYARSRERLQLSAPGHFLRRHCFTLCMTMEVEPRIAKQYKCQYCCSCKIYWGKGMEGGKKGSLCNFLADQKSASLWKKMRVGASYSMSIKLLLVARHILTMGLQKCL